MSQLNNEWLRFAKSLVFEPPRHISSVQRFYQDVEFLYEGEWDLTRIETGYTNMKLTQLKRHYLPEENVERAMNLLVDTRINKRKYGSVLIPHQGERKKGFTQNDFCMIGTTLTYYPRENGIHWRTHWRSMEVIKRGRGDLLLVAHMIEMMRELFDHVPIVNFGFKFDTMTFHPMMTPLMLPHVPWKAWLKRIKKTDEKLHRDIIRWWVYYFDNPERTYERYSSAHQVHKITHRQIADTDFDFDEMMDYIHKHHDGGPRG